MSEREWRFYVDDMISVMGKIIADAKYFFILR